MAKWLEKTLGEVTAFIAKGIPPKYTEEENENTIRVLNQKCNRNFGISYNESRIHDCEKKKVPVDKMLRSGDVLINSTGTGTAGRVAQLVEVTVPTTIDGHMILMRPSEELDPIYYGYAVKSFQSQIAGLAEGSTGQTEINRRRLQNEVIIRYPSDKLVQKNIGSFLANIDEKIKTNKEINKNLELQAMAIFNNAIEQSKSVTYVELGSLADVKGGKRLPKGANLMSIPNSHPYIRVRDLNDVVFASLSANYEYVDDKTQKTISRYITTTDDVLISIVGTIGLTAIVDKSLNMANLTENCVKVTNLHGISPEYLLLYLRSQHGSKEIRKGTVGAVQAKLPIKNIQALSVPLLPQSDLQSLNDTLKVLFNQLSINVAESTCLTDIRDSLLPKLMSGELDISNLDL